MTYKIAKFDKATKEYLGCVRKTPSSGAKIFETREHAERFAVIFAKQNRGFAYEVVPCSD